MKKLFILIFLIFILQVNFAFALEIYYPPVPGADPPQVFENGPPELLLANYAKYIVYLCMWVAGIIAMLALVVGGIRYILSTGNPERLVNAKEQIVSAFLGLLILLSAVTILDIINPNLTNLNISPLSVNSLPDKGELELAEVNTLKSAINPEVSSGRVIAKLFETYISEYPEPEEDEKWTPRIIRLKNRALAADQLREKVFSINKDLKDDVDKCTCDNTIPDPFCPPVAGSQCFPKYGACTGDPCKNSRGDIIKGFEENHNIVYVGDGITISDQMNREWELETIDNSSLLDEILRQEEELRLLKEQFDRLERARKYIEDCPLQSLYSYVQVLDNKKVFESLGGEVRITDFWNDVDIIYNRPKELDPRYYPIPYEEDEIEYIYDFATFYCDISGTLEQGLGPGVQSSEDEPDLTGEESVDESEQVLSETIACSDEAPFGDYLDRVERTTKLLIDDFKKVIEKEKEIIDTIDEFQEAIAECSSKRCVRICIPVPLVGYCYTWITCKSDPFGFMSWYIDELLDELKISSILMPTIIGLPVDGPCPEEVETKYDEINGLLKDIDILVNGEEPYDTPETVGIIRLLDEYVPILLEDIEEIVRYPMKECFFETLEKKGTALFNCSQAQGGVNPKGEVIYYCCQTEDENGKLSEAGKCYEDCYLEKGWKAHRDCVYKCLEGKGGNELPYCMHELNFYCCNAGED